MESLETPTEPETTQNDNETEKRAKIEAMLTPEQVHSDSVARRRRRFTKKRSASLTKRDPTPLRKPDHLKDDHEDKTTSDDEELSLKQNVSDQTETSKPEEDKEGTPTPQETKTPDEKSTSENDEPRKDPTKPKTPERPRRRFRRKDFSETESEAGGTLSDHPIEIEEPRKKRFAKSNDPEAPKKRGSLSELAQTEVVNLFNKTKQTITNVASRGRERFRSKAFKEQVTRSKSAPHHFTEAELIESFKRAQLLEDQPSQSQNEEEAKVAKKGKPKPLRLSQTEPTKAEEVKKVKKAKPFRPEAHDQLRQRRKRLASTTCDKIVEILDPCTSDVVSRRTVLKPTYRLRELFAILRMFSIGEIYRSYRKYKMETTEERRQIKLMWNRCIGELMFIIIYCGLGGMIFKFTEGSFENFYKCGVKRVKRDFIEQLWQKSHNLREEDWKSMARNKLKTFEEELHVAHEAGMTSYSGQRSWSFLNGIVYTLTVVTTIGYGHMYPTTTTGRALTIVYSIIGIPLFLIALTDFGKLFTRCIKYLWSFVRRLYYTGSCRKVRKNVHAQDFLKGAQMVYDLATFRRPSQANIQDAEASTDKNPTTSASIQPADQQEPDTPTTPPISQYEIDDEFNLPISVAIFILLLYIFFGAFVYMVWEQWDFFASFYFVFISMSTIGFGDFVPRNPICMIVSIVYLVFGLALMSMCINVVQTKLSDTFKQASQKIGATIGLEVAEDDGSITTVTAEAVEVVPVHQQSILPSTLKPWKLLSKRKDT